MPVVTAEQAQSTPALSLSAVPAGNESMLQTSLSDAARFALALEGSPDFRSTIDKKKSFGEAVTALMKSLGFLREANGKKFLFGTLESQRNQLLRNWRIIISFLQSLNDALPLEADVIDSWRSIHANLERAHLALDSILRKDMLYGHLQEKDCARMRTFELPACCAPPEPTTDAAVTAEPPPQ